MSRIEITVITSGKNKNEKEMHEFLVKELGAIENLIIFMFKHIFNPEYRMRRFEGCVKWSIPGLSALMEIFL